MSEKQPFARWALVEVVGHNTFAGWVTEEVVAGTAFVRVDVPAVNGMAAFTKLIGPTSIYAITPMQEEAAMRAAAYFRKEPLQAWQMPEPKPEPQRLTVRDADAEDDDRSF